MVIGMPTLIVIFLSHFCSDKVNKAPLNFIQKNNPSHHDKGLSLLNHDQQVEKFEWSANSG